MKQKLVINSTIFPLLTVRGSGREKSINIFTGRSGVVTPLKQSKTMCARGVIPVRSRGPHGDQNSTDGQEYHAHHPQGRGTSPQVRCGPSVRLLWNFLLIFTAFVVYIQEVLFLGVGFLGMNCVSILQIPVSTLTVRSGEGGHKIDFAKFFLRRYRIVLVCNFVGHFAARRKTKNPKSFYWIIKMIMVCCTNVFD